MGAASAATASLENESRLKPLQPLILVFARAPVPGRCKTRLIPRYGARGAAVIQHRLLRHSMATACSVADTCVELWCDPDTRRSEFAALRSEFGVVLRRQPRGDLGQKMALALCDALRRARSALLIGADAVSLTAADLQAALDALDNGECVLQPSEDGGYVLIGARRFMRGTLRNIRWSSGTELQQTRARLGRAGLSWIELPTRWDVDLPGDVRRARRAGLLG